MKIAVNEIIRQNILSLRPYSSARSINSTGRVFLDANESPELPAQCRALNRYPEPQPRYLRERLGSFYQIAPEQICMGRGSDEAIDLLVRMTCEPGKNAILTCPPTYGMYGVAADIQACRNVEIPMLRHKDTFLLDTAAITAALDDTSIKLFFICRPNNPTGELTSLETIRHLALQCGPSRILVVDEAYIEFCAEESAITLISSCPNIVVLRTFSKAWGLAGARFGVAISSPQIADFLDKVRAPYPVPDPVRELITDSLTEDGTGAMRMRVDSIIAERMDLTAQLRAMRSVRVVYESAANFLLVHTPERSQEIYSHLRHSGIIVRDRSSLPLLKDCLRISVGSGEDNAALIKTWNEWERETYA